MTNLVGRLEESTNTIQDLIRVFNKIKVDPAELEKRQVKLISDANKPELAKGSAQDTRKQMQAKHSSQEKITKGSTQMIESQMQS